MREENQIHVEPAAQVCVTCGQGISGRFCAQCGEKVIDEKEKSIAHFLEEFIHMLTHADHKFFRTLKYLFTKPGFLTREHLAGRRKLYTSPLALFFIGNLLYFLVPSVDAFNSRYEVQINMLPYSSMTSIAGEQKMKERHWTLDQMKERYQEKSGKVSKMLLILLTFLFSLPVTALFYSRKRYYFDHLIFATEFINYIIYGLLLLIPWILYLVASALGAAGVRWDYDINSNFFITATLLLEWGFLAIAARRVYPQHIAVILFKTLLLSLSVVFVLIAYRFMLFWIALSLL